MKDEDRFISLAELLFDKGEQPGVLASLIEDHGIWGWDHFDRRVHFLNGSSGASRALNRLAHQSLRDEREGDVPRSGVSRQPGQAEIHMLSVPLRAAESAQYR